MINIPLPPKMGRIKYSQKPNRNLLPQLTPSLTNQCHQQRLIPAHLLQQIGLYWKFFQLHLSWFPVLPDTTQSVGDKKSTHKRERQNRKKSSQRRALLSSQPNFSPISVYQSQNIRPKKKKKKLSGIFPKLIISSYIYFLISVTIDGFFLLSTQPIHGKLISHIHGLGAMSLSLRFKTVPSFILYSKKK